MRVNAAHNVDFAAWSKMPERRVHLRVGWHRYTATAAEALELARQLVVAVESVKADADDC